MFVPGLRGTQRQFSENILPFKFYNTFTNAMFKWFWTIISLGAPVVFNLWIQPFLIAPRVKESFAEETETRNVPSDKEG